MHQQCFYDVCIQGRAVVDGKPERAVLNLTRLPALGPEDAAKQAEDTWCEKYGEKPRQVLTSVSDPYLRMRRISCYPRPPCSVCAARFRRVRY
jgi:hypothetical protein